MCTKRKDMPCRPIEWIFTTKSSFISRRIAIQINQNTKQLIIFVWIHFLFLAFSDAIRNYSAFILQLSSVLSDTW